MVIIRRHKLSPIDSALRIAVALVFVLLGFEKLTGDSWVPLFHDIGLGQWFRYFTGTVQVTGALLFAIPAASMIGAALLASTMLGAVCVHLFVLNTGMSAAPIPGVLLVIIIAVWIHGERPSSSEDRISIR